MNQMPVEVHVLCVGHAAFDLVVAVDRHPAPDEKTLASAFISCGGGPAANAAITVARLGYQAAFAGYLGNDAYGDKHLEEFKSEGVHVDLIVRGPEPTPVSAIIVKPDGRRSVINYRGRKKPLGENSIDFSNCSPKAILMDGHEPALGLALIDFAQHRAIPTVLDAGSVHRGALALLERVDYVVASEKFAYDFSNESDEERALEKLSRHAPTVMITLGERGLIWKRNQQIGRVPAFEVKVVDTTGAGDAFHGAFAAGLATGLAWEELLRFASAAGALCCTKLGGRFGIPTALEVGKFISNSQFSRTHPLAPIPTLTLC
jgi:sulfofructose kinase